MEFSKYAELECACAKESRRSLDQAWFDGTSAILATNTRILAVVPATPDADDSPGNVSPAALKAARKAALRIDDRAKLLANGTESVPAAGVSFERREDMGLFPKNAMSVMPQKAPPAPLNVVVYVNANELWNLIRAIGAHQHPKDKFNALRVQLTVEEDGTVTRPVRLDSTLTGCYGAAMPIHPTCVP